MDTPDDLLRTETDGPIARFTINRPEKRNAMTLAMWQRMGEVFEAWADDPGIRVIVVCGAGDKCFCAGNDISEFAKLRSTPEQIAHYNAVTHHAYSALRNIPKPTIARLEGSCMGGGLEVAQLCDIQIAADTATFGVPPAKLGLGYKLDDTVLLVENVGVKAAKEMLLTGRRFAADDALRWGLVNRVVPAAELDATVQVYADEIAANAPLSVKTGKLMTIEAAKETGERDLSLCQSLVDACNASEDFIEGQRAFAEKRPPNFKGK
ncbi:MAG: enoyl-CoA hydratase [Rhodospirillaceae bacterium]|nr:enoyl-CoA hydratase [Rhodospirillaceae bacterium]